MYGAKYSKSKWYYNTKFSADSIKDALEIFRQEVPAEKDLTFKTTARSISNDDETWAFDTDDTFFAAYRRKCRYARFYHSASVSYVERGNFSIEFDQENDTHVSISLGDAPKIEKVFEHFEKVAELSRLAAKSDSSGRSAPQIFIGHGRNSQWRDLKDHLADKHGYNVIVYEVGARAGHTIRDILEEMLTASSFALLVMTGEDQADPAVSGGADLRARQNVVHELGLFQGRLGFHRAIAVVERRCRIVF